MPHTFALSLVPSFLECLISDSASDLDIYVSASVHAWPVRADNYDQKKKSLTSALEEFRNTQFGSLIPNPAFSSATVDINLQCSLLKDSSV